MAEEDQQSSLEQMRKVEEMLYRILEPEARERLNNIRLVNMQRYLQIANFLVNVAQQGKIDVPLDDATLKQILLEATSSREFNIVRK